jgi:hypothetical protein
MGAKSMRRFDKHVRTCITSSAIEAESDIWICAPATQLRIGAGNAGRLYVGRVAEGTPWPLGQGAHDVMAKGHAPLEQQRRQPQERNGARLHWGSITPVGWTTRAPPEAFCAAMSSTVQTAVSAWLGAATFCGSDGPPPTYAGFFWSTPLTCAPSLGCMHTAGMTRTRGSRW